MIKINKKSIIERYSDLSCDYLIIGSGAGGSVASYELVEKGKDCILVEEGDFFEIDHFKGSFSKSITETWRNAGFTPIFGNPNFAFAEGRCLGGSTYINGGLFWRTPEKVLNTWNDGYLDGYDSKNLEEHFSKIEKKLNVVNENNEDGLNLDSKLIHEHALKNNLKSVFVPRAVNNCKRDNVCYTGCSSGAKQSVLQSYIFDASHKGLRLILNSKVKKLNFKNNQFFSAQLLNSKTKKIFNIKFKNVILACGVTQSPILLNHSLGNKIFNYDMEIHLNFRISAIFKDKVFSDKGTMFTTQIQEFIDEGDIFMSTNFNKSNFFSTISNLTNDKLSDLTENIDSIASYVLQTKPQTKVKIFNAFEKQFLRFNLSQQDFIHVKKRIKFFSKFLFSSGAKRLILPNKKNSIVNNSDELDKALESLRKNDLQMLSVHGMSSIPMGKQRKNFFNSDGRSTKFTNLYGVDASVLPSNIGESPQGTIMAFSHEIIKRMKI